MSYFSILAKLRWKKNRFLVSRVLLWSNERFPQFFGTFQAYIPFHLGFNIRNIILSIKLLFSFFCSTSKYCYIRRQIRWMKTKIVCFYKPINEIFTTIEKYIKTHHRFFFLFIFQKILGSKDLSLSSFSY